MNAAATKSVNTYGGGKKESANAMEAHLIILIVLSLF